MQLFYICFGVGVLYTVISFLLGQLFDFMDFDGDFELGTNISPLKPAVIAVFVTVFGGTGIILLRNNVLFITSLIISLIISVIFSYIIYRYVIVELYKAQNTSAVERQKLIGQRAKVTLSIKQGSYGKIKYVVNGNTYSSPAKSEDGSEILKDEEVEIVYIDKNTYYVKIYKGDFICQVEH